MQIKTLAQRSPDYDKNLWWELDDLCNGGYAIARNAKTYLPMLEGENPVKYEERCRTASYLCYLGQIRDYFVSALFAQDLQVTEAVDADDPTTKGTIADPKFWPLFSQNADRRGASFQRVLRGAFGTALLKKKALIACDFPASDALPKNMAEEIALGINRGYCWECPIESLIDWDYNDQGEFAWACLYRTRNERKTFADVRGATTHEWKVWSLNDAGLAQWQLFQFVETDSNKLEENKDAAQVGGDTTTFTRIPLIELQLPEGLCVGTKLGTIAKEHFQRRSALISAQNRSLLAIPVLKRGPEVPADDSINATQMNENRGSRPVERFRGAGAIVIGKDDDFLFVEPTGAAYEIIDRQLSSLKDEMFRIAHQMAMSVDNDSNRSRQSGVAKSQDKNDVVTVLGAMGQLARDWAVRVYKCIADARKDKVVWTPRGLDKFDQTDRPTLLLEATQVDLVNIPSKRFKQEHKTNVAFGLLPNLSPETQDVIRSEIIEGVAAEDDLRAATLDAKQDAVENPPPPPPPAQQIVIGKPNGKAPPPPPQKAATK